MNPSSGTVDLSTTLSVFFGMSHMMRNTITGHMNPQQTTQFGIVEASLNKQMIIPTIPKITMKNVPLPIPAIKSFDMSAL